MVTGAPTELDKAFLEKHPVVLRGVTKRFDMKVVLDGVSLAVREGEVMTLAGASGQGKTVLLKQIMGLMQPDSGEIYVLGHDATRLTEQARQDLLGGKVAMVFQGSALFDSLDVGENVAYGLRERNPDLPEEEVRRIVREKLALVDLPGIEDMMPAELSGGMKKRVAIARALALEPRIILYDEPTTGLDPANVRRINALVLKLRDTMNVTSIIVTHDMASVRATADRIALLDRGRIIALGTWDEMEQSDEPRVRQFLAGDFEA